MSIVRTSCLGLTVGLLLGGAAMAQETRQTTIQSGRYHPRTNAPGVPQAQLTQPPPPLFPSPRDRSPHFGRLPIGAVPPTAVTGNIRFVPGAVVPGGGFFWGGGFGYPYGYGNVYAPTSVYYAPQQYYGPVMQREVVVIREQTPEAAPAEPRAERDREYYLPRQSTPQRPREGASDVLDSLRKAWLNGDPERLAARVPKDRKIRIYVRGRFAYEIDGREFARNVEAAMQRFDTLSFDLDRPRTLENGHLFVTGRHVLLDEKEARQEIYVSYELAPVEGQWVIVGAGSSTTPVDRHAD